MSGAVHLRHPQLSASDHLTRWHAGTKERKIHPAPGFREKKIVFALTEPGAGSVAGGNLTRAVKDGEYYI